MKLWYISFAGGEPDRFLGGLHIWAETFEDAITGAHASGQYPGGDALGGALPADIARRVPKHYIGRVITFEEYAALTAELFPEGKQTLLRLDADGNIVEVLPNPDK